MGNFLVSLTLIALLFPLICASQKLSNQKIYRRCYSQLVQAPVPINDPIMNDVIAGALDPIDACLELLEKGNLDSSGLLKNKNPSDFPQSQKILQTFHDFHRSWFSTNTLEQIQGYNEEFNKGSTDIYDPNEQAYFLTKALFSTDNKYSQILQGYDRLKGIRAEDSKLNQQIGLTWNYSYPSRRIYGANANFDLNLVIFRSLNKGYIGNGDLRPDSDFALAPKLQIGELVGIQKNDDSFIFRNIDLDPLNYSAQRPGDKEANLIFSFDLSKSYGGGILGIPSYFLMNMGHPRGLKFNGTTKLPRRWVKASFETFLCSQFPTLRENDITEHIVPSSPTPFRKASSCVQCHATLDQAAGVARNLVSGASDFFQLDKGKNSLSAKTPIVLTQYQPNLDSNSSWTHIENNNFHITQPKGRFLTRSTSGELLSFELNSINELGIAMSSMTDFYNCAAKRYFEFLTGINVPLYDRKDPRNEEFNKALTEANIQDRDFIESLGRGLQQNQSLKELVQKIIKSKYYVLEDYR